MSYHMSEVASFLGSQQYLVFRKIIRFVPARAGTASNRKGRYAGGGPEGRGR